MENLKTYIFNYFEFIFILAILLTVVIIHYIIPHKLAFLSFYYLPILAMGYTFGKKSAILGSFFCFTVVSLYAYFYPHLFVFQDNILNVALSILTWGCFLILSGVFVGGMHEKLGTRTKELENTNKIIENINGKMEETLYTTMDSEVAQLIINGRLRNEKRKISVLFSDLAGFTAYCDDIRPEMVVEELNRFLAEMEPILSKYRGHIDKYIGDGIMCEFGAPTNYATHALQAVLAGIKMQERLAQLHFPCKMRIGISTGLAITGLVGSQRRAYTAIGDIVNLASRLERSCQSGKILIDEETYREIEPFVDAVRMRSFKPKREEDLELIKKIEESQSVLEKNPKDIKSLFEIGRAHYELREVTKAIQYYENILAIDPENIEVKLAYAEAYMNRDKYEKIGIKGKKKRVTVYEIIGIKDVMSDRNKIPEEFYRKYRFVEELINIPDDVLLSIEALDGSIGRSKMVAVLSYAIADHLGLHDEEKQDILIAAYLSDIGKESIPHHILNRTGRLSENEFKEIERHPLEGIRIAKNMGYESSSILDTILYHHEMYNGGGYPFGLSGEEIPCGARIVAVADTYDALTSWRPYRERLERDAALSEIQRGAETGTFDPRSVEALMELMRRAKRWQREEDKVTAL
jgi:HD-GYP domain-containing protein (c-di-GMP phosphodiesterase class II)